MFFIITLPKYGLSMVLAFPLDMSGLGLGLVTCGLVNTSVLAVPGLISRALFCLAVPTYHSSLA